jgi:hypothetical protein
MKKRFTVYTQGKRFYQECGWQGSSRSQSDDYEELESWAKSIDQDINKWKIIDNRTKEVLATNT